MKHIIGLAVVLSVMFSSLSGGIAGAVPLGSFAIGPVQHSTISAGLFVYYSERGSLPIAGEPVLFRGGPLLASADSGSSLFATASNAADFATFTSMLTNGVDDTILVGIEGLKSNGNMLTGGVTSGREAQLFFGGVGNAVDFDGFDISSIELRYDSIQGSNPLTISATLIVHGAEVGAPLPEGSIPEPATLAIFGLGLAGLGMMRRRKRESA